MYRKGSASIFQSQTRGIPMNNLKCRLLVIRKITYIMTKQTKIVTGLLAGAALGAAIALVLASDKNDALKQKATDWFCDLLDNSKDKFGSVGNLLAESIAKVRA